LVRAIASRGAMLPEIFSHSELKKKEAPAPIWPRHFSFSPESFLRKPLASDVYLASAHAPIFVLGRHPGGSNLLGYDRIRDVRAEGEQQARVEDQPWSIDKSDDKAPFCQLPFHSSM